MQKAEESNHTFRVRGVPLDWNVERLQTFLAEQNDATGPVVKSLADEVHGRSRTATISFHNVPGPLHTLQTGRALKISLLTESNELGRRQLLTVDDGFHGITTLYTPQKHSYKIE
jgi:hypothetical protein